MGHVAAQDSQIHMLRLFGSTLGAAQARKQLPKSFCFLFGEILLPRSVAFRLGDEIASVDRSLVGRPRHMSSVDQGILEDRPTSNDNLTPMLAADETINVSSVHFSHIVPVLSLALSRRLPVVQK